MSCTSPLGEPRYESARWVPSGVLQGVRYLIHRMSLGRKIELTRRIRDIGRKVEFFEASGDARQQLEAAALASEIDREYLAWGLAGVEGLVVDGTAATPEVLVSAGPIALAMEAVGLIKAECGLSEEERKN